MHIYSHQMLTAVFALAMTGTALTGCSQKYTPTAESPRIIAETYPVKGAETMTALAPYIPAQADFAAAASYGTVTDFISSIKGYGIINDKELQSTLSGLGEHYKLNPSKLNDYFKAGFDTNSGAAAGIYNDTLFIILAADELELFKKWWNVFVNEELGRPAYTEREDKSRRIVRMEILGRDYACYALEEGAPVIMAFTAGKEGTDSCEKLQEILEAPKRDAAQTKALAESLPDSPLVVWSSAKNLNPAPKLIRSVEDWIEAGTAGLSLDEKGPRIDARITWKDGQFDDADRRQWAAGLTDGTNLKWGEAILAAKPTSVMRAVTGAKHIDELLMNVMQDKYLSQYKDIKKKLTQRFIKLDVTDQIIQNIGSVWAMTYGSSDRAAAAVIFKDPAKSDAFFAKVNVLKKFISGRGIEITNTDGMLQTELTLPCGRVLNIAYKSGLLTAADKAAAERVESIYTAAQKAPEQIISQDKPHFYGNIMTGDIKEAAGNDMLGKFRTIHLDSDQDGRSISFSIGLEK